ncbi:MAG: sodium:calcium antiporter, partial [Planctomycetes bacterium]|nr:sodium:calcium antiporter [Planctomycetota bacterium]
FQPITADRSVISRDIPIMLGISLFLILISYNSMLGTIEGITLFGGIILYTFFNYFISVKESKLQPACEHGHPGKDTAATEEAETIGSKSWLIFLMIAGIAGVAGGAQLVVDSAVDIMSALGVDEKFVGLTIVAFGTSLPELATSVVAALRKEMDISIGNLIGSNVFNILGVLGAASLVRPITIPGGFMESGLIIDCIVMLFVSFLPWLMMRKSATVSRGNGIFLLACYGCYLAYLVLKAA